MEERSITSQGGFDDDDLWFILNNVLYDVCLANRSNIQLLGSTGSNLCSVLSLHGVVFLCFFVFYCIALHGFCVLLYVIAWHIKA